jgi:hypothetical protein
MHVSFRHARRVMLGAALGVLFLAVMPGTGQAQTCSDGTCEICISPKHQTVNVHGGSACKAPNRYFQWAQTGAAGSAGPMGLMGVEGLQGPTGPSGPNGPQGPAGPAGAVGVVGPTGATGPGGLAGITGQQGLQGLQGATGPTGPTGPSGTNGTNGTQSFLLVGGDLGATLQAYNYSTFFNQFLLGNASSTPPGNSPLYYGPGNGVDAINNSEAVPIDAGTASQLYVQTSSVPGDGESYTFDLLINGNPTPVTCAIGLPPNATLTECKDLVDTQAYNAGDTIELEGTASCCSNPTNVMWSVVITQTTPVSAPIPLVAKGGQPTAVNKIQAPQ